MWDSRPSFLPAKPVGQPEEGSVKIWGGLLAGLVLVSLADA